MTAPFHLGWFLSNSFGVHGWDQPWGGLPGRDWFTGELQVEMARALERACFDFLLLEDSMFVPDNYGGSADFYLRRALRAPKNDPLPLVPLLAQATTHLGIVPTISTTFYPPFLLARLVATLDAMSGGRVGCNFVTSTAARAAQNFGLDEHVDHDTRYDMAGEFVDVITRLWHSWDADAIVDQPGGAGFVDPAKVRSIDHDGRFFRSRGPLNTARPPQGTPVLVQAGGSPAGRRFAAERMDVTIAAMGTVAEMKSFRADIRRRTAAAGRDPDACKVMFVFAPVLGETDGEAQDRAARRQAARRDHPEIVLAQMASLTDIDFARFGLDDPLPELATNGQQGTFKRFMGEGSTLREIAANYRFGWEDAVGTPDRVAAIMAEVMDEVGGDGWMIGLPATRRAITEVTDGLVPVLRRRGLTRDRYTHAHFRDNLHEF